MKIRVSLTDLLPENWFLVVQTVGIMGTLVFAALSDRRAAEAQKVADLLKLAEMQFETWKESFRPELQRIYAAEQSELLKPLTPIEERFLNQALVHYHTGWLVVKHGSLITMSALKADIKTFLEFPLPNQVWEQTKERRDPEFVKFVERVRTPKKRGPFWF